MSEYLQVEVVFKFKVLIEPVYETAEFQIKDTLGINESIGINYNYTLFNCFIIFINTKCALNNLNLEEYHIRVDKILIILPFNPKTKK